MFMVLGSWLLNGTMTLIVRVIPYHIARVTKRVMFIKFYDVVFQWSFCGVDRSDAFILCTVPPRMIITGNNTSQDAVVTHKLEILDENRR